MQALTTSASLERLKRVETLMRENLNNGKEEFWQQTVFNENQWVLAQIFLVHAQYMLKKHLLVESRLIIKAAMYVTLSTEIK